MNIERIGKKVLVTTSDWFYAPDGLEYKAVFGTLKAIEESSKIVGFNTTRGHYANWVYTIGNLVVMGCQVQYIVYTDEVNSTQMVSDWHSDHGVIQRPNRIYITN